MAAGSIGASSASADSACTDIKAGVASAARLRRARLRTSDGVLLNRPLTNAPSYGLVVEPQQVILGEREATDWRLRFYPAMGSMPFVAMQPVGQFVGSADALLFVKRQFVWR